MISKQTLKEALKAHRNKGGTIRGNEDDTAFTILHERVKTKVLRRHIDALVNDVTFFELAKQLQESHTLSYEDYLSLSRDNLVPDCMKRYVSSASVFLTLTRNESGCILTEDLLHFIQRSIDVESTLLHLLLSAKDGFAAGGFITEKEFERYLFKLIPELSGHACMPKSFYPYYVFTAARRFFFFLDSKRTLRINIKKLGHSTIMEELLYLKRLSQVQPDVDPAQVSVNWFSGQNALKLYNIFLDLDKDKNGCLSVCEMLQFSGTPDEPAQLTRVALERIFEANITHSELEMDYKAFLDLCLAIENKTTVESMAYFWRALDLDHTGRLSPETITLFYRGVYEALRSVNYDAPNPSNIVVEVFDLVGCNDARGPTFRDLVKSGQGHVVFSMLIDCGGFWNYDNRESLMQQQGNGGGGSSVTKKEGGEDDDDEDVVADDDYF